MHFHRDVLANADTFCPHVLQARRRTTSSPARRRIAFTFGLGGLVVFPLRVGAATLLVEKATPDAARATLIERARRDGAASPRRRPTRRCSPTGQAEPAARRCAARSRPASTCRAPTWEAFREATGVGIIDGIGATEMLHIFISAADDDIRPGSTGRPVPGYVATVLDPDGNAVPDGEPGRLAVKGPTGCRYLADERQRVYVQDGWNITGDTFIRDADGYFWYQARSDDMIISSGYNIAGPEVEEALLATRDVMECARGRLPRTRRAASVVKAFVVLAARRDSRPERRRAARKELQDHVKAEIAPYKYPRRHRVRRRAAAHLVGQAAALPARAERQKAGEPAL